MQQVLLLFKGVDVHQLAVLAGSGVRYESMDRHGRGDGQSQRWRG